MEDPRHGIGPEVDKPLSVLEAVGRTVIRAEQEAFVANVIDDEEHVPRIARLVDVVTSVAAEVGLSAKETSGLRERMLAYGQRLFVESCAADLAEDEDPVAMREEGARFFREVLAAHEGKRR